MKFLNLIVITSITIIMCLVSKDKIYIETGLASNTTITQDTSVVSFGAPIKADNAQSIENMRRLFKSLKTGDTISAKLHAEVKEVCQAKGCWMTLDLAKEEQVMVKFKDYAFFVPKNISGREVIISGKAYIEEVSVEEQRHYAEDEGQSKEEIELINLPKNTYMFIADGVLIKPD